MIYHDRYRTVPETEIIAMLRLAGFAYVDAATANLVIWAAFKGWGELGLGRVKGPEDTCLYDPVEVVNTLKRAGLKGQDRFWHDHYVTTGRRLVQDLAATGGPYDIRMRRRFDLRGISSEKMLRLRMPLPLSSAHDGPHGRVEITPIDTDGMEIKLSEGRLEARLSRAGHDEITLGADIRLMPPPPSEDTPDAIYLRPREGLIAVTQGVADLARDLGGGSSPDAAVRRFWDYMQTDMVCGAIHYDQIDPAAPGEWVLKTGLYDCQLGSALFIALCRARGIPARLISGHVLYRRAPTNHYWAEVWLGGHWQAFDFLSWDLSEGGRDQAWRDHFYGRVDDRLITQRWPQAFTGALGVAVPQMWHMVQTARDEGIDIAMTGMDGAAVYRDFVAVR